ncbi:MAG: hypothetical protein KatS3mg102_2794 [Planctomycetota bacterium]|nr:MAG: hypothetical protein KatS3mg102_2794 [Planctomycetota bacterium]
MGHAYTPGLRVARRTRVRKRRTLPLPGTVRVEVGERVRADQVVAETHLPGDVHSVNVVNRLGITPSEIREYMLKQEGDPVRKGEPIARAKAFFGLLKTEVPSPIDGSVETISTVTGQVLLRTPPKPVQVRAFIDGTVLEVEPGEGVVVETVATFIQGIFGVGRECWGRLAVLAPGPEAPLEPGAIRPEHRGALVVGGSLASYEAIARAREVGAAGVIAGGIHDEDLRRLLGYDLGVAITGEEEIGITVVVTEGFGEIAMAERTFRLLQERQGAQGSLSGATQIRAGVIRPEIILPYAGGDPAAEPEEEAVLGEMGIGDPVRCIRRPYFGRIGRVKSLPVELVQVESETRVRVVEVEFDGESAIVPRANVERIELG